MKATYGVNFDRMVALKTKFDPGNLFRLNANVAPAGRTLGLEKWRLHACVEAPESLRLPRRGWD